MRLHRIGATTPRNWTPAFSTPTDRTPNRMLGQTETAVLSYFPTLKGEPRMERLRRYHHVDLALLLDADHLVTGWTADTKPLDFGSAARPLRFTPDFRVQEDGRSYSVRILPPGREANETRRERHNAVGRAYREFGEHLVVMTTEALKADFRLDVAKELFRSRQNNLPPDLPNVVADIHSERPLLTLGSMQELLGGGEQAWRRILCLIARGYVFVELGERLDQDTPVLSCQAVGYRR